MAVNDVYRLSVDYTYAQQITSPISGKTAFVPYFAQMAGNGAPSVAGAQETLSLVTTNTPAAQQTVLGGTYIFNQQASVYGTVTLQVLGPDGATWQTVLSKTASDTTGGSSVALGSNAVVRSTVAGTTGAVATLSRVP